MIPQPIHTDSIYRTIEDLVAMAPRATGTPGGKAAAAYVNDRFEKAGLHTEVFEVDSYAWKASEVELEVGDERFDCSPILHSGLEAHDWVGTKVFDLDAEVIDIGTDKVKAHDVRGKIVLFDLRFTMTLNAMRALAISMYDPGKRMRSAEIGGMRNPYITSLGKVMTQAKAAGALGVIGVLADYPESNKYHNEYYRKTLFELPGVWITAREGQRMREVLRQNNKAELELTVTRKAVTSQTIMGILPGRTNETIMIQSHHDSVSSGAVEDASGTAEVIALAEHYGALAAKGAVRDKTLMFITFDTHFTGYQSHMAFATKYALNNDSPFNIVLNATIEHVGRRATKGPGGGFTIYNATEPRGIFINLNPAFTRRVAGYVRKHELYSTALLGAAPMEMMSTGIPTDASFTFVAGVPTISLVSGPLYLYDDADTLECIDKDQLVPVAEFFIDVIDDAEAHDGTTLGILPQALRRKLPRGKW